MKSNVHSFGQPTEDGLPTQLTPLQLQEAVENDPQVAAVLQDTSDTMTWKALVMSIVEAEQLYQVFKPEIKQLYVRFLQATYSTPWPELVEMFYVRFFLRWIGYMYCMIQERRDYYPLSIKGNFLVDTLIPGYRVLLQSEDLSDFMKALVLDGVDEAIGAVPHSGIELMNFISCIGSEISEIRRASLPDSSQKCILQLLSKPEIEAVYRWLCNFSGDYHQALTEALDHTHLIHKPHSAHGVTLSCGRIYINELEGSRKHPGLILGFTVMTFIREFSNYLRRYRSSIGVGYHLSSPRLIQHARQGRHTTGSRVSEEQIHRDMHAYTTSEVESEMKVFTEEAALRALQTDEGEEEDFNWLDYQQQRARKIANDTEIETQQDIPSPWEARPIASEILAICPRRKRGEGGASVEIELFGEVYPCITLEASKVLLAACLCKRPIHFPKFQDQMQAAMQVRLSTREYEGFAFKRGLEVHEDRYTMNYNIQRCGRRPN